jgi:non-specific serine/threonine protein kinase
LRIAGETTFPVLALGVPDLRLPFEPRVISQFDAVQLFLDRAAAAQADFELTEHNATAIAAICHRVDGIPLAIELAAARVRGLSVQNIAERLKDRFKILKGGDQTALPRQQTLRALIDWSYDLLTHEERRLFRQLAVFAGGFPLEAAEAVCECGGEDVVDLLGRLVEKSLVTLEPAGERYRMLETVREYAQEKLDASDDREVARSRHLDFYVALADRAKSELLGPNQAEWLSRMDAEHENILAAHAAVDVIGDAAQKGLMLVNAIKRYWTNRGLLELGHRITAEALARSGAKERNLERARGLFNAGQLRYLMGHYGKARACLEESLAIARELGDAKNIAAVLQPLGLTAQGEGDLGTAHRYLDEALGLAREVGDARQVASALNALGQHLYIEGDADAAHRMFEGVVSTARALDDAESLAIGLLNLTIVALRKNEPAHGFLAEAFEVARGARSTRVDQSLLDVISGFAALREAWEKAGRFLGAAERSGAETGLRRDASDEAFLQPLIRKTRSAMDAASFDARCAEGRALPREAALEEARAWLATCR